MSADTRSNAPDSTDTMYDDAAASTPPISMTEEEFLRVRANEARRAMSRMVSLIGKNLGHGADPRIWTRAHPWIALGTAAVGGFAAVNAIPNSEERELHHAMRDSRKRRRAWQRHFTRELHKAGLNGAKQQGKPGLFNRLIEQLLLIARPVIQDMLHGAVKGPEMPPDSNGGGVHMDSGASGGPGGA